MTPEGFEREEEAFREEAIRQHAVTLLVAYIERVNGLNIVAIEEAYKVFYKMLKG